MLQEANRAKEGLSEASKNLDPKPNMTVGSTSPTGLVKAFCRRDEVESRDEGSPQLDVPSDAAAVEINLR